jgi:hypothetical protein
VVLFGKQESKIITKNDEAAPAKIAMQGQNVVVVVVVTRKINDQVGADVTSAI